METARHVLRVVFVIFEVLVLFNLLVAVHELGHFLAARWRGLVVEKFRIWFGHPIWKTRYHGVEYSLGWIPAGGFVALPQMAPMETIEGRMEGAPPRDALSKVSPLDKIIVAFAGPLFSLGLAFVFAVIVWAVGRPVSEAESTRVVGYVAADGPAAKAGLRAGDEITAVDGQPVRRFFGMDQSVQWYVARSEGATIPVDIVRDGRPQTLEVAAPRPRPVRWWQRQNIRQIGVEPAYTPVVGKVEPGSPAAQAGLRKGDQVLTVGGEPVRGFTAFEEIEQSRYNQPTEVTARRDGRPLTLTLPPMPFTVGGVQKDSPAEAAGLQAGDVIRAVAGRPATRFADLREALQAGGGKPVELTIVPKGGGPERTVAVTPARVEGTEDLKIGLGPSYDADGIGWEGRGLSTVVHENPFAQIRGSVLSVVNTISGILSPRSDLKLQHLGGPVMIFKSYYYILLEEGWRLALWFSVVLNVNLALLNLLPFPVLDGGHISLALVEAVRRRPVNLRLLEVVQTACVMLLLSYFLYITFYDVGDQFSGGNGQGRFRRAAGTEQQDK